MLKNRHTLTILVLLGLLSESAFSQAQNVFTSKKKFYVFPARVCENCLVEGRGVVDHATVTIDESKSLIVVALNSRAAAKDAPHGTYTWDFKGANYQITHNEMTSNTGGELIGNFVGVNQQGKYVKLRINLTKTMEIHLGKVTPNGSLLQELLFWGPIKRVD